MHEPAGIQTIAGFPAALTGVVLAIFGGAFCGAAGAAPPSQARVVTYSLDFPSQSLNDALQALALASRHKLLYSSELVDGKRAPALKGEFTTEEAVHQLLSGTGLTYEVSEGLVLIRSKEAAKQPVSQESRANVAAIRLAEVPTPAQTEQQAGTAESDAEEARGVPEILVKGKRTFNADIRRSEDAVQPYIVFDAKTIQRSGATNLEDFLRGRLTVATSFESSSQSASAGGNISSINLRGLGADETLILIDGRRVTGHATSGSPNQVDLNGIPLAAIERIEVLPTTASGIYGGGATGGAVNVVMKREYAGAELQLTYGGPFDSDASRRQVDLSMGHNLEGGRTNILLTGSYSDANTLRAGDRDFLARGRNHVLTHNPGALLGANTPYGYTTNIRSTGASLVLDNGTPLGSIITSVPVGYAGIASDGGAGLVANAGRYNLDAVDTAQAYGRRRALTHTPTVSSAAATVRRNFTSWLDVYLELAVAENRSSFLINNSSVPVSLLADAPGNPFRQNISVAVPMVGADRLIYTDLDNRRAVGGVLFMLPFKWRGSADYSWSEAEYRSTTPFSTTGTTAPIASGAIDVFRDVNAFPLDFSAYLPEQQSFRPVATDMRNAALRFSGPLFAMPGGPLTTSILFEHRKEVMGENYVRTPIGATIQESLTPRRSQKVQSVYLELLAPLVSASNSLPGVNLLELQVAGRWDDYLTHAVGNPPVSNGIPTAPFATVTSTFTSIDPTVGLRYGPWPDLTLRSSYGTGFLPPSIGLLVPNPVPAVYPAAAMPFLGWTDPLRGGELLGTISLTSGGGPYLRPEQSTSVSAGLILTPRVLPGLRVSVDWTRIRKTDNITSLIFSNADQRKALLTLLPHRVTRNPAAPGDPYGVGQVTAVDASLINLASGEIEAYDGALDYKWMTTNGSALTASVNATYMPVNNLQVLPGTIPIESAGVTGNVNWRANATLLWDYRAWSVSWTARFFGSYAFDSARSFLPSQGSNSVPSQIYHDLFVTHRFAVASGPLADTEIRLGVNNLFNTDPPIDVVSLGSSAYYSPLGDPRLANYSLSIQKNFAR